MLIMKVVYVATEGCLRRWFWLTVSGTAAAAVRIGRTHINLHCRRIDLPLNDSIGKSLAEGLKVSELQCSVGWS
jgi:hypothetical protein